MSNRISAAAQVRRRGLTRSASWLVLAALLGPLACGVAMAQQEPAWPTRTITLIVPGAPGGTTDIPSRLVAKSLSALLGQTVLVENRAGSGGIIGTQALLAAPADGHTLLVGNTGSQAINYSAYKKLPYKPADLLALTDMISFPNVLVVNAQSRARTVAELVGLLKNKPGELAFASSGVGQTSNLTGELFKLRTATDAIHVPYKGSTPATLSAISGETAFMFDNLTAALPHITSGRLRALAVTGATRAPSMPDVPTMAQAGVDGFVVTGWLGFFAHGRTPATTAVRLGDALRKVLKDPEVVAAFRLAGGTPGGMSQPQFDAFVQAETQRWQETIRAANISLD